MPRIEMRFPTDRPSPRKLRLRCLHNTAVKTAADNLSVFRRTASNSMESPVLRSTRSGFIAFWSAESSPRKYSSTGSLPLKSRSGGIDAADRRRIFFARISKMKNPFEYRVLRIIRALCFHLHAAFVPRGQDHFPDFVFSVLFADPFDEVSLETNGKSSLHPWYAVSPIRNENGRISYDLE